MMLESEMWPVVLRPEWETARRNIQLWFKYFAASFFKSLGNEMLLI